MYTQYYYHRISYTSGKQVRFEAFLALFAMKSFTDGLYEALYPARNDNDKLFFRIDRNVHRQPSEAALFMADKDILINYWVLDFSKREAWLEDPKNLDNVRRFYVAFLMGQVIQFSTVPGKFHRADPSYVGAFTVCGSIITTGESSNHAEDKQRISEFIEPFLENTLAPKTVIFLGGQKSNYLFTFRTESYPFFEELFEKGNNINKVNEKFKLVQDCVDIKALNSILGPKGENNPKWNDFYERFTSDIHNRKFDNMLLSLFVNSIITIKNPSVAPNGYVIRNPDGSYQYLSPDQYDVHPEFYKALYFNRFGGY